MINYGIDLYDAMGYKACSANTLKNYPKGSYENLFKEVSKALSNEKISRYSANEIRHMNSFRNEEPTRECKVCGRVDLLLMRIYVNIVIRLREYQEIF